MYSLLVILNCLHFLFFLSKQWPHIIRGQQNNNMVWHAVFNPWFFVFFFFKSIRKNVLSAVQCKQNWWPLPWRISSCKLLHMSNFIHLGFISVPSEINGEISSNSSREESRPRILTLTYVTTLKEKIKLE